MQGAAEPSTLVPVLQGSTPAGARLSRARQAWQDFHRLVRSRPAQRRQAGPLRL
jgi:hypothetical protein